MKWLEIITVRSVLPAVKPCVAKVFEQADKLKEKYPCACLFLYHHANIGTDTSIHIHWKGDIADGKKSPLGEFVAQALKKFGLVNYSIWINDFEKLSDENIPD